MLYNLIILIFYVKFFKCISKNSNYGYINFGTFSNVVNNNNNLRSRKNVVFSKIEIKMPALSSTMTTGKIVKWNKNIGDYVNLGDIIMTVESDKADMDVEAFDEGFLRVKRLEDGCEANVGDVLGVLTTEENENMDEKKYNDSEINKTKNEIIILNPDKDKTEEIIKEDIHFVKKHINDDVNERKIFIPFIRCKKNKARINKWLKNENDFIKKDDVLFYVQDDKSTIEVESPYSGIIKKLLVKEGQFADLDKEVAIISITEEKDNQKEKIEEPFKNKEDEEINQDNILMHYINKIKKSEEGRMFLKNLSEQEEKTLEERLKLNYEKYNKISNDLFRSNERTKDYVLKEKENYSQYEMVLPSASELMRQNKLNPKDITNRKTPNRITYEDVNAFLNGHKNNSTNVTYVEKQKVETVEDEEQKTVDMTNIQKSIKNNMMLTLTVPVFRVTHLIKTNELLKLYEKVKQKISMSVIINKCVATVLLNHPLIYSTYIDKDNGKILYNKDVNIGNALGLPDSLLTPVLKKVDKKDIYTLSNEWKMLVEKGKNGLLSSNDMIGSNFYISNLGMFNTYQFDAILPKNSSCILSIGTNIGSIDNLEDLKIQKGMMMTLTCDHRHIYGSHAATFMNDLSKFIEKDIMKIFL
ncbi:dihydrolipoamide acyltransferase component E2 [Plasmodium sp. gorilla clade G3]|nr:dihydrolipoamide acyltransferase component E2 [Plasmodium sp. gorilla clade G3]